MGQGSNVCVGQSAGGNLTNKFGNVIIGSQAMLSNNNNNNVAVGANAGKNLSDDTTPATDLLTGVYIGSSSSPKAVTAVNEIVIGAGAVGNGITQQHRNRKYNGYLLAGNVHGDQFTLNQLNTAPAISTAPGDEGRY